MIKIGGANMPPDTHAAVHRDREPRHPQRPAAATPSPADAGATRLRRQRRGHLRREGRAHHDPQLHAARLRQRPLRRRQRRRRDLLVEGNYIHDNGNVGSIYEHNNYTEALRHHLPVQPLRPAARRLPAATTSRTARPGSSSATTGSRAATASSTWSTPRTTPSCATTRATATTYVYGNVLIEPDGAGNSQIVHYGGDSGRRPNYRKGTLYFYHNTVVSTRAGNTTLFRLSTNDETRRRAATTSST